MRSGKPSTPYALGGCLMMILLTAILNYLMAVALVFVLAFFKVFIPLSVAFVALFILSLVVNGLRNDK